MERLDPGLTVPSAPNRRQIINFGVVPRHLRIPFVAAVSFGWTVIYSTMQGKADAALPGAEAGKAVQALPVPAAAAAAATAAALPLPAAATRPSTAPMLAAAVAEGTGQRSAAVTSGDSAA